MLSNDIKRTDKTVFSFIMAVSNIVAVGRFTGVDFKGAATQNKQVKKKKRRKAFNGTVIRLPNLATCLLFPNGAVTVVGVKRFEDLEKIIADRLLMILPAKVWMKRLPVNSNWKCATLYQQSYWEANWTSVDSTTSLKASSPAHLHT